MEEKRTYCVYKHTCIAKGDSYGKVYIGITGRPPQKRWRDGKNYGHSLYFNNAIKKYGWDNFSHEILETGLSRSEAAKAERRYIKEYHSKDPAYGFNLTDGGDSLVGSESPVARPVVVFDARSGIRLYDFETQAEADQELGITSCGVLRGESKTTHGYIVKYLDDVGAMMVLPRNMRFRPRSQPMKEKPVDRFSLDGKYIDTFPSVKVAAQVLYVPSPDAIGRAARGASKSAAGYQWRFHSEGITILPPLKPCWVVRKESGGYAGRAIDQIDLNTGSVIHTYPSLREAARAVNGNRWDMKTVADKKNGKKSAAGYGWRYHEE